VVFSLKREDSIVNLKVTLMALISNLESQVKRWPVIISCLGMEKINSICDAGGIAKERKIKINLR
jgi:hypothetical protein